MNEHGINHGINGLMHLLTNCRRPWIFAQTSGVTASLPWNHLSWKGLSVQLAQRGTEKRRPRGKNSQKSSLPLPGAEIDSLRWWLVCLNIWEAMSLLPAWRPWWHGLLDCAWPEFWRNPFSPRWMMKTNQIRWGCCMITLVLEKAHG